MSTTQLPLALVTGGATGIGAACCRELARAGFAVGVHYNTSQSEADALVAELPGAFAIRASVTEVSELDKLHDQIKERGELQVLVNNAGATADAPFLTAKLEDLERLYATNLRSTWYLSKRLARLMAKRRQGRIINISSVVGSTGNPGQSAYAMTKAAIDNLTHTLALELAPYNILVNSVAPGFIDTRMTEGLPADAKQQILARIPLGRMGSPIEVARLVRFLAVEGSYCTGSVFHVNGGLYGG